MDVSQDDQPVFMHMGDEHCLLILNLVISRSAVESGEQEKQDTILTDLLLANTQRVSVNAPFCLPKGVDGMQSESEGPQPCRGKGWPMYSRGRHSTQTSGTQKQAAAAKTQRVTHGMRGVGVIGEKITYGLPQLRRHRPRFSASGDVCCTAASAVNTLQDIQIGSLMETIIFTSINHRCQ